MLLGSRGTPVRCLVVWTIATVVLGLVVVGARAALAGAEPRAAVLRRTPLDVAVTEIAALTLLGCTLWMWAATTAVVAEALRGSPGTRSASRGVPAVLRRMVLAACGVALAGGLAQPSYAAPHVPRGADHSLSALSGLPLPDRAVAARAHHRTVRVRAGDTLWSLAARDLPAGSPADRICARWRAIYAANRSLIGPDPDVIVPGQRLRLPGKDPL